MVLLEILFVTALACRASVPIPALLPEKPVMTLTAFPPTATLVPSATTMPPTPFSLPSAQAGRVVHSEHFNDLATLGFSVDSAGDMQIRDGLMILSDSFSKTGDPWADGHVAERSIFSPRVGDVSVFLFKAEKNTYFGFHYELYESTDGGGYYRGINLDCCLPGLTLDIDSGYGSDHATRQAFPVDRFQPGTWYFYSLRIQPDGTFTAQLWERDRPDRVIFDLNHTLDPGWAKPGFTFIVAVEQGTMEVDEYQEVESAGVP